MAWTLPSSEYLISAIEDTPGSFVQSKSFKHCPKSGCPCLVLPEMQSSTINATFVVRVELFPFSFCISCFNVPEETN